MEWNNDRIKAISAILDLIEKSKGVLIFPHEFPDGDAVGSSLALNKVLKKLDKRVEIISDQTLASRYFFLDEYEEIKIYSGESPHEFAKSLFGFSDGILGIYVDCSEKSRVGKAASLIDVCDYIAVLDHHKSQGCTDEYCYVDKNASATGVIIFKIIENLNKKYGKNYFDESIVQDLISAIYFDTGGLRYANTNPEAFETCYKLHSLFPIDIRYISYNLFDKTSKSKLCIHASAFSDIKFFSGGKIALVAIAKDMVKFCGASDDDMDGISTELRNIEGVEVSFFVRERGDDIKVSIRSCEEFDASEFAEKLGGGGHAGAAGITFKGKALDEVLSIIKEEAIGRMTEIEGNKDSCNGGCC